MIIPCTVRVIYYDNRDSPITVLTCMCITQETFIDIVTSWYEHYCADANILILSYLPCWSYVFSTIAFIMWKSFVCKFVLPMLNVFILMHKWFIWMVVICHVFYIILCFICIFYHVLCQKWQNKSVKSYSCCWGYCIQVWDKTMVRLLFKTQNKLVSIKSPHWKIKVSNLLQNF